MPTASSTPSGAPEVPETPIVVPPVVSGYADYKIVEEREVDGLIYQKVRFYEGDITTEDEWNGLTEQMEPVTRYRRTAMVEEVEYTYG